MPAETRITFYDILQEDAAVEAREFLSTVPEDVKKSIGHHLEALANLEKISWRPPDPRKARRFADHLEKDASKIESIMNLHFGSELPLADPRCHDLPENLRWYSETLRQAVRSRRKRRSPGDRQEREDEIVRLLDRSLSGRVQHHYAEAAALIQAAYNAGSIDRTTDEDQLRKRYDRQSFRCRLRH